MNRVVLDTDVSSLSLNRWLPYPAMTWLMGKQPCITFTTLGELIQWAQLRLWGPPRPPRLANDSWIAACAPAYGLPPVTLNVNDYGDFAEYEGLTLISR